MPPISLSMGLLRLRDQNSRLKLFANTTLHFHNCPTTGSVLSEESILDAILARKYWVARGSFCHIDISILLNDSPTSGLESLGFLERLSQHICSAPVWTQLGLSVTLDDQSLKCPLASKIHIYIDHDRFSKTSSTPSSSVSICSIADVRPPDGIPIIYLDRIHILLDFLVPTPWPGFPMEQCESSPTVSPKKDEPSNSLIIFDENLGDVEDSSSEQMLLDETCPNKRRCPGLQQLYPDSSMKTYTVNSESRVTSKYSENRINFNGFSMSETNDCLSLQMQGPPHPTRNVSLHIPCTSQSQSSRCSSSISTQRDVLDRVESSELPIIYQESACAIAELAVRLLIGGKQARKTAGMKCIKPPLTPSLSEVAPALFSPGFLKVMAERAVLFPSVNQAFSNSLLVHAQSPILRQNIQILGHSMSGTRKLADTSFKPQKSNQIKKEFSEAVRTQLWHLAQQQLYDKKAARRLKRSRPKAGAEGVQIEADSDSNGSVDMLNLRGSPQCYEGETPYEIVDEDAFEDLLGSDKSSFESDHDNIFRAEAINIELEDLWEERAEVEDVKQATHHSNPWLESEESVDFDVYMSDNGDAIENMLV